MTQDQIKTRLSLNPGRVIAGWLTGYKNLPKVQKDVFQKYLTTNKQPIYGKQAWDAKNTEWSEKSIHELYTGLYLKFENVI